MPSDVLTWIAFTPLLGTLFVFTVPRERATWIRALALLASIVPLALATWLCFAFRPGAEMQFVERADWLLSLRAEYHVGVDGLSLALVWLTTATAFVSVAANVGERAGKASYARLLLLEVGIVGALVSLDLLLWFTFWQASALAIGMLPASSGATRTATKCMVHASVGSALILVALVGLRLEAGTFAVPTLVELARAGQLDGAHLQGGGALLGMPFRAWCFAFLFLGCASRIPLVPLHAFFTGALLEAPTPLALLQGGAARAMAAFALLRVCFPLFPASMRESAFLFGVLGVASILHGAFTSLRQRAANGVFACNALGQLGWMLLGAAALTTASTGGALLQLFSAAAASAALFQVSGLMRGHGFDRLCGSRRVAPRTFVLTTLAIGAGIGLPGFAMFVSQASILAGVYGAPDARFRWLACVALLGWFVGAAGLVRTWWRIFFGAVKLERGELADATPREAALVVFLLAASVVPGIVPGLFTAALRPSVLHWLELLRGAP